MGQMKVIATLGLIVVKDREFAPGKMKKIVKKVEEMQSPALNERIE